MKERILITGASGFLGHHLITAALKNNFEVFAGVRKSSATKHLTGLAINLVYPDFDNIESLNANVTSNKYNYIIHAAGVTKARSAAEYNYINAAYTYNLALASADVSQLKKFVLVSSLAAVGPLGNLSGVIDEHTVACPLTSYGRSKLLAEEKLRSVPQLNHTILRPTGVYGPGDKDIFLILKQISLGMELYMGRADQKLSLIYAEDLANAAIEALYAPKSSVYNLSDGNYYSRYQLGFLTRQILHKKTLKIHLPVRFVRLIAKIAEVYSSLSKKAAVLNTEKLSELMAVNWDCSIEHARAELNFKPVYNLEQGLTKTLNWYTDNKWL